MAAKLPPAASPSPTRWSDRAHLRPTEIPTLRRIERSPCHQTWHIASWLLPTRASGDTQLSRCSEVWPESPSYF